MSGVTTGEVQVRWVKGGTESPDHLYKYFSIQMGMMIIIT